MKDYNEFQVEAIRTAQNTFRLVTDTELVALTSLLKCSDLARILCNAVINNSMLGTIYGNCALGLIGETGEVIDDFKKALYQGHSLDISNELGDLWWYLAILEYNLSTADASLVRFSMRLAPIIKELKNYITEVGILYGYEPIYLWDNVIEKLRIRYADGFTIDESINRSNT